MEEPPLFANHYRILFMPLRLSGLAAPWVQAPSATLRVLHLAWDTALAAMLFYMLFIYVYTLETIHMSMQDLGGMGISTPYFICGLLMVPFYWSKGSRLRALTDHMDRISTSIHRSTLGRAYLHRRLYSRDARYVRLLVILGFRVSSSLPFLYCLVVPITDYMRGRYRARFPIMINSPFDDRVPGVYELVFAVIAISGTTSNTKKMITDFLLVGFFKIHTGFLNYLSVTMESIRDDLLLGSTEIARSKLFLWIELHQEVIKNFKELILAFSPLIVLFNFTLICNVVCAMFILAKKDNDNTVQAAIVCLYVVVSLTFAFLLSDTAGQLSAQASKLAEMAYSTPWYTMKKSDADIIKTILLFSNRTLQVTAYRTFSFLLNRETFANFLATAVSAFITLCQLKDSFDE